MILVAGDTRFKIACTPENLRELGVGFLISEGLVVEDIDKLYGVCYAFENKE